MCTHAKTAISSLAHACAEDGKIGSRRRRLWQLSVQCHCPVIGVCFPMPMLRRLIGKSLGHEVAADDYEIHVGTVAQCATRNPLSELLQRELEQRYAGAVRLFRAAKTPGAVWEMWAEAVNAGNVPAALWAALTHPMCDDALEEGICRDLHMIQHQAGSSARADLRKLQALQERADAQLAELQRLQERNSRLAQEKLAEIDALQQTLMRTRVERDVQAQLVAALHEEIEGLRAAVPELDERMQLQEKLAASNDARERLEKEVLSLRREMNASNARSASAGEKLAEAAAQDPESLPFHGEAALQQIRLCDRNVLCVGGRARNVANYRKLVEQTGAQFMFHDGGIEDNPGRLDANLAAADLVICQTGCISHNAYWRVKDFCKRHEKQCIFVDNPSTSSLARNLIEIRRETAC